jgi:Fibronectin type III domain
MNTISKFLIDACCVAGFLTAHATSAQTFPVQLPNLSQVTIDLRPNDSNSIIDTLTKTSYVSGSSIQGAPASTFTGSSTYFTPNSAINLPAPTNWSTYGFTIAAQLNTSNAPTVGTVFTLVDTNANSNSLLFAILRDSNGRWWTGKRRDAEPGTTSFIWYAQKAWDPFSPCVAPVVCATDTLYVSFLTNGQIQLDEVATLSANNSSVATDQYDWESGLLNFGLPQQGYNVSTWDGAEYPVAPLQTTPIGGIQLTGLSATQFGSGSILGQTSYPAISLNRLAVFSNPSTTPGYGILNSEATIGNSATSANGILRDQSLINPILTAQTTWLPCSSGQFEQPAGNGDVLTLQYDPANLPTPCNVPSAPQSVTATSQIDGSVKVSWTTPAYEGATPTGGVSGIQNYQVSADDFQNNQRTCSASGTATSCNFNPLFSSTAYLISVTAQGVGGNSVSVSGFSPSAVIDYSPSGLVPYPPPNLTADLQPTVGAAVITWSPAPVPSGAPPVTSYTLVYEQVSPQHTVTNVTSPYTITNLAPGDFTSVSVSALNSVGASQPASILFYLDPVPPSAPTNLVPTIKAGVIDLSWSAPSSPGSFPVTSYNVALTPYLPTGTPLTQSISTTATDFVDLNSYVGYVASVSAVSQLAGPAAFSPVLYPKFLAPDWVTCAADNATCNAPAGSMVRYGDVSRNALFYAAASGGNLGCNSANFNGTPSGASTITCSYASQALMPPAPGGFTFCAYSGSTCSYPFPGMVAYGGGGQFVYSATTGSSITCKPANFPLFNPALPEGTPAFCSYQGTINLPGIQWCADGETGTCKLGNQPAFVGYGFDAALTYVNQQSGAAIPCQSSSFYGANPTPGFKNSCYIVPYSAVPFAPAGATFCATDGNLCQLPSTNNAVSRGANGYYTTINVPAAGQFLCASSSFPYDAAKGMTEACFYNTNVQTYPPSGTVCSAEFGVCDGTSTASSSYMIYGSSIFNGSAAYVSAPFGSQQVSCSLIAFGSSVGASPRSCYQATYGPTPWLYSGGLAFPPLAHLCSPQNGSCPAFGGSDPGYLYVYGSGNVFYSTRVHAGASTIPCNASSFFGDPNPGTTEYCGEWYTPGDLTARSYTLYALRSRSCFRTRLLLVHDESIVLCPPITIEIC